MPQRQHLVKGLTYTVKKCCCLNLNLAKIWTNPNVGLKMHLKNVELKVKVEVGLKFEITFLTQHLGFVHILPKFGFKQPSIV